MKFKCILLLVTLLLAVKVKASLDTNKRRCILHDDNSPLIELSATCGSCRSLPPAETDLPLAMIILASDEPEKSPLLAVASRLVATRMRVVIVRVFGSRGDRDNNEQDVEPILRNKITSSIPCHVTPLVSFKWVPVKGVNGGIAMDESPYDAVDKAEAEYQVLEFLVETDELPSVMVLEAANVGGQLVAEKLKIPSVLLAPHSMLALVAEKTAPSNGLASLFRRRRDSFALGRRFMQMNKLRQTHGLPLLRNPSDYFERSTVVLVNELFGVLAAPSANRILPLHAHFVSPLLPPCIPCKDDDDGTATIIVSTPRLNAGADTRALIRGISVARAHFQSFVDDACHPENPGADIHSEMCTFAEKMATFKVVWQIQNDTTSVLPELPPVFMSADSSPMLEIISGYSRTVAVITHCDPDSYPVYALGESLLCLPSSDAGEIESPRLGEMSGGRTASLNSQSIATALVEVLLNIHETYVTGTLPYERENSFHPVIDGGYITAQIIETIATAPRNDTDDRLREQVNGRVNRTRRKSKADMISLLVASSAWNVLFVISLGYCLRLIYVTTDPQMTGQTKRFLRSPSIQVVFQYLEELDWALLFAEKFWWCDESMIHNRIDAFLRRYEPADEVPETQPRTEPPKRESGHSARRKRHTRKR